MFVYQLFLCRISKTVSTLLLEYFSNFPQLLTPAPTMHLTTKRVFWFEAHIKQHFFCNKTRGTSPDVHYANCTYLKMNVKRKDVFSWFTFFFITLCMRYIVSAEPKSFFNFENRTEKVFQLAQPQTSKGRRISSQTETECIVFYQLLSKSNYTRWHTTEKMNE